jgi:hypothetical protein
MGTSSSSSRFAFGLIGDQPNGAEENGGFPGLIQDMNAANLAFSIHAGGIGTAPADCTDSSYGKTRDLFDRFAAPLVYTPGEDEWLTCQTGGYDPQNRLAALRKTFFPTDQSRGTRTLLLERQAPGYPENARWTYKSVTFATLHVLGAGDGLGRTPGGNAEASARREAAVTFLDETFDAATSQGSAGVVLVWHGDPHFGEDVPAYNGLRGALRARTIRFAKPVAVVHTGSGGFRVDKPMVDDRGRRVENFTRVQTSGPADTRWVQATVDPTDPGLFNFAPRALDPVIVGAGDIATCRGPGASATAGLLDDIPGTVFTLGDNAYPSGTPQQFRNCYDPTWGRHRSHTRPAVGNHDYATRSASGYFTYFGAAAGERGKGYYSYDLGAWHIIALNGNCSFVGGCFPGSAQEQWLRADLAAHPTGCTLAYWHQARFTSNAEHPNDTALIPLWQALYDHGADVVLSGHAHDYERFAPQTPTGTLDRDFGIRQFVVGTGGASHYGFRAALPNSEVRNGETFGVLKLTLHPNSYAWAFIPAPGSAFNDSGVTACHGPPRP